MCENNIIKFLFSISDEEYKKFCLKLIPTLSESRVIGARIPKLRKAAQIIMNSNKKEKFISVLPHQYYEEDIIHSIIVGAEEDFSICLNLVNRFLPYIDNWAVCDILKPNALCLDRKFFLVSIKNWIEEGNCYTKRFGIEMLLTYFLDVEFDPSQLELVASADCREYYVSMMAAWYFAEALIKQYDDAITFLIDQKLDIATHNRTISKACDSLRITASKKEYLKKLRIKNNELKLS